MENKHKSKGVYVIYYIHTYRNQISCVYYAFASMTACAAESRAIGTRNGEQDT